MAKGREEGLQRGKKWRRVREGRGREGRTGRREQKGYEGKRRELGREEWEGEGRVLDKRGWDERGREGAEIVRNRREIKTREREVREGKGREGM